MATTPANFTGIIGVNTLRTSIPVGTASTTVALSGPGDFPVGTTVLLPTGASAIYTYAPSTYGTITAATRFDRTATGETTVNASGAYTTPASVAIPAGSFFWAHKYASAL